MYNKLKFQIKCMSSNYGKLIKKKSINSLILTILIRIDYN